MRAVGNSSCSTCNSFGANPAFNWVTPVTLPPGRLRLATRPSWTGSEPSSKTMGMAVVAACRQCGRSSGRGNHGHLTMNQIGHHRRQSIILALRPAVFDQHVLTFDIARPLKALTERSHHGPVPVS